MIGLLVLALAIVLMWLIWITGPRFRMIGFGLLALVVLSDVVNWGVAKLFARSLRRDEIPAEVRSVALREADFVASPSDPAANLYQYTDLMKSGVLDRLFYRPSKLTALRDEHVMRGNTDYEVRVLEDPVCNGPDRFSIGFGRESACLVYKAVPRMQASARIIPLQYRGPLSWPVEAVRYVAIISGSGKVRARACVTYRGAFWAWVDTQMFNRWNAGGTVTDPPRPVRRNTCDGDLQPLQNWQELFTK